MGWKITFDGKKRDITPEERAAELKDDPYRSIWEEGTGVVVDVEDLTIVELSELAKAEGVSWQSIYDWAGTDDMERFQRVVEVCAKHAGIEPPEPESVREFMRIYRDSWEYTVPGDEKPIMNGFPQTPGEPESGSSSTSPGDTDGLPTSSDDNDSVSS